MSDATDNQDAADALASLDPHLVDWAVTLGHDLRALERARDTTVQAAVQAIEAIFMLVAKSGGLRGQQTDKEGNIPAGKFSVKASTGCVVVPTTAGLVDLHALWEAIPKIMNAHVTMCLSETAIARQWHDTAFDIRLGAKVIKALLGSDTTPDGKRTALDRALHDKDMRRALALAEDANDARAFTNIVRQQAGERSEEERQLPAPTGPKLLPEAASVDANAAILTG